MPPVPLMRAEKGALMIHHPWNRLRDESGAATAEYAITIMAAVGFAGLLVAILRSGEVQGILTDLVHRALTVAG